MLERVRDAALDERGDGFLVPKSDAKAMAACLLQTPRDAWREMGARARLRVETELSWGRTFESVMGIYRRALEDAAHRCAG